MVYFCGVGYNNHMEKSKSSGITHRGASLAFSVSSWVQRRRHLMASFLFSPPQVLVLSFSFSRVRQILRPNHCHYLCIESMEMIVFNVNIEKECATVEKDGLCISHTYIL